MTQLFKCDCQKGMDNALRLFLSDAEPMQTCMHTDQVPCYLQSSLLIITLHTNGPISTCLSNFKGPILCVVSWAEQSWMHFIVAMITFCVSALDHGWRPLTD